MAHHLKVDPIDLHMSSDHMDVHHSELTAAHGAADGVIEAAHAGWVGASASALATKMAEWQATTTTLCSDIAAHGAAYKAAANGYTKNDTESAETLNRQL